MHGMCTKNYCECVNDKLQYTTSVCMVKICTYSVGSDFLFLPDSATLLDKFCGSLWQIFRVLCIKKFVTFCVIKIRVWTILVLEYRVLANTVRYWGGSCIERYLLTVKSNTDIHSLSISGRRPLLSKPQSNSSRQRAAATMQHNCLNLLANNSGRKSRVGRRRQEVHL